MSAGDFCGENLDFGSKTSKKPWGPFISVPIHQSGKKLVLILDNSYYLCVYGKVNGNLVLFEEGHPSRKLRESTNLKKCAL